MKMIIDEISNKFKEINNKNRKKNLSIKYYIEQYISGIPVILEYKNGKLVKVTVQNKSGKIIMNGKSIILGKIKNNNKAHTVKIKNIPEGQIGFSSDYTVYGVLSFDKEAYRLCVRETPNEIYESIARLVTNVTALSDRLVFIPYNLNYHYEKKLTGDNFRPLKDTLCRESMRDELEGLGFEVKNLSYEVPIGNTAENPDVKIVAKKVDDIIKKMELSTEFVTKSVICSIIDYTSRWDISSLTSSEFEYSNFKAIIKELKPRVNFRGRICVDGLDTKGRTVLDLNLEDVLNGAIKVKSVLYVQSDLHQGKDNIIGYQTVKNAETIKITNCPKCGYKFKKNELLNQAGNCPTCSKPFINKK